RRRTLLVRPFGQATGPALAHCWLGLPAAARRCRATVATLRPPSTEQLAGANISLLAARSGRLRVLQQRPERGRTCRRRRTPSPGRAVRMADCVPATVIRVVILLSTVVLSRYPLKMTVDTRIAPRTRRRPDQALHLTHLHLTHLHMTHLHLAHLRQL